jgi:predicted transcriptional regulator
VAASGPGWDADEPLTVRAASGRLDYQASTGDVPAYTTIMTIMTILCGKGFLTRAKTAAGAKPRAWCYRARVSRESYLASVIRQALDCTPDRSAVLFLALAPVLDSVSDNDD